MFFSFDVAYAALQTLLGPTAGTARAVRKSASAAAPVAPALAVDCEWRPGRIAGRPDNPGVCVCVCVCLLRLAVVVIVGGGGGCVGSAVGRFGLLQ